jgi:hypothetical protein
VNHWFEVDKVILNQVGVFVFHATLVNVALRNRHPDAPLNPQRAAPTDAKPGGRNTPSDPQTADETLDLDVEIDVGVSRNVGLGRAAGNELVPFVKGGRQHDRRRGGDVTQ